MISQRNRSATVLVLTALLLALFFSDYANPDSLLYLLKRVQEKAFMRTKGTPSAKADYLSLQLDKRLEELQNLVKNKSYFYLVSSSLRYSTTAGRLTQIVIDNRLKVQSEALEKKFLAHQQVLQDLLDNYPQDLNTEYKYLQDDINYLKLYLEMLHQSLPPV